MRIKNDQAGLTLVELLVTILVASIVTLAATTVLLFGLRINNQSTKTSMGQNTVQVLMEALEDVAAEAKQLEVTEVVTEKDYSWLLSDKSTGRTFFSYSDNVIYTGKYTDTGTRMAFLENVQESYVTLAQNGLLTIDVVTPQGSYSTSVYCRMTKTGDTTGMDIIEYLRGEKDELPTGVTLTESISSLSFLKILASQYGSRGEIINPPDSKYKYYSEWYLDDKDYSKNPSWNKDTPWCACYISWAMAQVKSGMPSEAHVDKLMGRFSVSKEALAVGNLVFFDWDKDKQPQHVGVVLAVDDTNGYIYTIEGNTAGKVAVRKYAVGDTRIMGYGVLNWS